MLVPNLYVCLAEPGLLGQPWDWPVPCRVATSGTASVCFTPGVRLTDSAGSELSVAHQDRAGGCVMAPRTGLVGQCCGLPGQGLVGRLWQPTRTRAGGLVGWCMAHQDGDWQPVC